MITEHEARQIIEARATNRSRRFDKGYNRSRNSPYLLSGGLFVCSRCGSNLIGMRKTATSSYYICGSQPHRRGLGCGRAVYVPKDSVETEVLSGIVEMISACVDEEQFTDRVNAELRILWNEAVGYDPSLPQRLAEIDAKIANIRGAVENGLTDTDWANKRLQELSRSRSELAQHAVVEDSAPQIDVRTARAYRAEVGRMLQSGTNTEKKKLIRACVEKVTMAPDTLEIEIRYRVPEAVGASCESGGGI